MKNAMARDFEKAVWDTVAIFRTDVDAMPWLIWLLEMAPCLFPAPSASLKHGCVDSSF